MSRLLLTLLLLLCTHLPSLGSPAHVSEGNSGAQFGHSVSEAGDVNGDGRPDFIVGAPLDDDCGLECGRAYLWLAEPFSYSAAPDLVYGPGSGSWQFGFCVAGIGDFNDDGFDDVAIGAPFEDLVGVDAGAVYIYFGGSTPDAVADLILRPEIGDAAFGHSICRAGDLDDDGVEDLLIGAPYADAGAADNGAVYYYRGSAGTPSTTHALRFDGELPGDNFGWSVAPVPNFRGDGLASFVVGAPNWGGDYGRAYLFHGESGATLPDTTFDVVLAGATAGDLMGHSVASIGDFNGDSRTDIAAGAPGNQSDKGVVRIWLGKATPGAALVYTSSIYGGLAGDRFGESVAGVGDHLGSSLDDLLVGAPMRNHFDIESGAAYLFAGGGNYLLASDGVVINPSVPFGVYANNNFGFAVGRLGGDMDGDLKEDLLIGAPGAYNESGVPSGAVALLGSSTGVFVRTDEPLILSILDVGGDQGGRVRIEFEASLQDDPASSDPVIAYDTFRRIEEGHRALTGSDKRLAGWDYLGSIPSHGDSTYNIVVPTLADSTETGGIHWSVYFIRAATASPFTFYDSLPDSSYSVDNLAPGVPQAITAAYGSASVVLDWADAEDSDFQHYRIYRGDHSDFVPTETTLIERVAVSSWTDATPNPWGYHYKVSAVDFAGNEGEAGSVSVMTDGPAAGRRSKTVLRDAHPNPFNPTTTIRYSISAEDRVQITIYDVAGREVLVLVDEVQRAGEHSVRWNGMTRAGSIAASGVYVYQLRTGAEVISRRMCLLK